jgi:hypothetical protein
MQQCAKTILKTLKSPYDQLGWSRKKEEQGSILHLSTTHFMHLISMDA